MQLIQAELPEQIIGCGLRVHRALGPGFLEKVYEEALAIELVKAGFSFERQKIIVVLYEQKPVGEHRLDLLIESRVVVELKACKEIEDVHLATARSYLKATGLQLALVLNFAKPTLEIRRVVLSG
ncbi:MAG TPA: GxxExxY protein [Opitutaceae bacterium]|jgi:GxxExxY protein|nr:GxxExxY protein [Opitutaceae bacterium]